MKTTWWTGRRLAWGVMLLTLAGIVLLLGSIRRMKQRPPPPPEPERAVPVTVWRVAPRAVTNVVTLTGTVEPAQRVTLAPEQPGRVAARPAGRGDPVAAGQLLLQMDDALARSAVQQAELNLREAQRDYERQFALEKTGAVALSDFQRMETRRDLAAAQLDEARTRWAQCRITAPTNGTLDDHRLEVGDYAKDGEPAFVLLVMEPLKIVFDVPERDVAALAPGRRLAFTVPAAGGARGEGEVTFVAREASDANRAFRAELTVTNASAALRAGMIADVALPRAVWADAVALPLAAIVPQQGQHLVYVARAGRAERRRVDIAALLETEALLASGVAPGEEVVLDGNRALSDGALLKVAPAASAE